MENLSYVGLSHQIALKQQMNLIANNIANMTTPGFKAQGLMFEEYLTKTDDSETLSMVVDRASWRDTAQGSLNYTNNPLDLALSGDGFFKIDTPEGMRYTRAGNFALNNEGQIVTANGELVLGEADQPITIPEGETHIEIDSKGVVSTESGEVNRLKIVRFEDPQALLEMGGGLYDARGMDEIVAETAVIAQGALEGSNVQPVLEMTKMMEVMRSYQATQRMLQSDHDRQRSAIRTLSQVN